MSVSITSWPPVPTDGRRKVVLTVATKGAIVVLGAIASIAISRALGPTGRGSYYVLVAIATIALSLGHFSVEHANAYLWSARGNRRALTSNAVLLGVATGGAAAVVSGVVVLVLGPRVVPVTSHFLLWLALASVPFATVILYLNGLAYLSDRINAVNVATLLAAVVQCGLLVAFAFAGSLTVATVIEVWFGTTALPLAVLLPVLRPSLRTLDRQLLRKALGIGLRYHAGMVALLLLYRIDALLLNGLSTKVQVGLYSLAVTLAEMVYLVTDSMAQVVLPAQMSSQLADARHYTVRVMRLNALAAVGAFGVLAVTSPFLIPIVYGRSFAGSVGPLLALGPGVIALATARPVGSFLLRLNRPGIVTLIAGSMLALNVLVNLILIPKMGAIGAGVASSIAYVVFAALYVAWLARHPSISWRMLLPTQRDARLLLSGLRTLWPGPNH